MSDKESNQGTYTLMKEEHAIVYMLEERVQQEVMHQNVNTASWIHEQEKKGQS